jgi:hypothetical protein
MATANDLHAVEELLIIDGDGRCKQKKTKSVLMKVIQGLWKKKMTSIKSPPAERSHLNCPYDDLLDTSFLENKQMEAPVHDISSSLTDVKSDHQVPCGKYSEEMKNVTQDEVTIVSTPGDDDLWVGNKGWVSGDPIERQTSDNHDWFDGDRHVVEKVNRKLFYDEDSVKDELQANEKMSYQTPCKQQLIDDSDSCKENHPFYRTVSEMIYKIDANLSVHDDDSNDPPRNDGKEQGHLCVNSESNPNSVKIQDLWDAAKDVIDAFYLYDHWKRMEKPNNHLLQSSATDLKESQTIHERQQYSSQDNWTIKRKPLKRGDVASTWASDGCLEATEMGTELQYKTPKKTKSTRRRLTQTTIVLPTKENQCCEIVSSSPSTIPGRGKSLDDSDVFSSIDSVETCTHTEDTKNDFQSRRQRHFIYTNYDQEKFSPFVKRCIEMRSGANKETVQSVTKNSPPHVLGNFSVVYDKENQVNQSQTTCGTYDDSSFSVDNFPSPVWRNEPHKQEEEEPDQMLLVEECNSNPEFGTDDKLRDLTIALTNAKALLESLRHLHIHKNTKDGTVSHDNNIHASHAKIALESMKTECNGRLEGNIKKIYADAELMEASKVDDRLSLNDGQKRIKDSSLSRHEDTHNDLSNHTSLIANRILQLRQSLNV